MLNFKNYLLPNLVLILVSCATIFAVSYKILLDLSLIFIFILSLVFVFLYYNKFSLITRNHKTVIFIFILYSLYNYTNEIFFDGNFKHLNNYSYYFAGFALMYFTYFISLKNKAISLKSILLALYLTSLVLFVNSIYEAVIFDSIDATFRVKGSSYAIVFGNYSLLIFFAIVITKIFNINLFNNKILEKICFLLSIFFTIVAMISSGTKNNIIVFPILAILSGFLSYKINGFNLKNLLIVSCITILSIFLALFLTKILPQNQKQTSITNELLRQIETVNSNQISLDYDNDNPSSSQSRLRMWKYGFKIFLTNPLFGIGNKKYKEVKNQLIAKKDKQDLIDKFIIEFNQAHNGYINTLAELGLTGLILFLLTMFVPLWYSTKKIFYSNNYKEQFVCSLCSLLIIAFLGFNSTETVFNRSIYSNIFFILMPFLFFLTENNKNLKDN